MYLKIGIIEEKEEKHQDFLTVMYTRDARYVWFFLADAENW